MKGLLFIALLIALFAATVACTSAAAQTEPTPAFDEAQYIAGITEQATVTADLNLRTDALLTANEALWPTVQAFYGGVSEFQSGANAFQYAASRMENIIATFAPAPQPTPVPPTPQVIVQTPPPLDDAQRRAEACVLLTVEYIDSWPGFGPATANDIRVNLGC